MKMLKRTLSTFMAVCMLLNLLSFSAAAEDAKRTIEMGFGEIKWTLLAEVDFAKKNKAYFEGGNIKPEYANTKVALIPITMKATTGESFDIRGAQFPIKFDPSVLQYKTSSDIASQISMDDGTIMGVTGTKNIDKANQDGSITLNYVDLNGETYTVKNGSVVGFVFFFLKDETKKQSLSEVSFGDGSKVKLTYGLENNIPLYHETNASAVGSVPAYDPSVSHTYTVKFNANNDKATGSMPDQIFKDGETKALSKNTFTLADNTFTGWNTQVDGKGTHYDDEASFKAPNENGTLTLYAEWKPVEYTYTVKFNANNDKATGSMPDQIFKNGETKALSKNTFTLADNTFTGWNTQVDGKGTHYNDEASFKAPNENGTLTLYAEWKPDGIYSITLLPVVPAEGGKIESDKNTAKKDEQVTLTVTPDLNKGYVLKQLTVKDSAGNDVPFEQSTTKNDGTFVDYTFIMPDSAVTVQVEFYIPGIPHPVKLPEPEKVEHGTLTVDKKEAVEAETVTVTVSRANGWKLKEGFPKYNETSMTMVNGTTYTFVMPNSDVTVTVDFETQEAVQVTYAPGEGNGKAETREQYPPFNLPSSPFSSPAGKDFDGWTLSGKLYKAGTEISESDLASGTTFTASYKPSPAKGGCYVATAVYGSYDCPEVWTLRRFRDNVLAETWYGRLFIKLYYAVSPTAVKLFGDADWFQNFWRGKLDSMVANLQANGFEDTPYQDTNW